MNENITYAAPFTITVDGEPVTAYPGQTLAAALHASGRRVFRATRVNGRPRGLYCAMGVCFDCVVDVDGETTRACMRSVENGMKVTLPTRFGTPEATS
jgi:predicted molibdopterin-dependent oxidoreductase YjgC